MSKINYDQQPGDAPVDFVFEKMLKKFQREVKKDGKLEEIKRRQRYTKPSEIKRLKSQGKWRKF